MSIGGGGRGAAFPGGLLLSPLPLGISSLTLSTTAMRSTVFLALTIASVQALAPVILIPGLGGSVFKAKLHDAAAPHGEPCA